MKYYPINEQLAKEAKEANSFWDYVPDSCTNSYKNSVDYAYQIADEQIAKEKLDETKATEVYAIADRYARKLADWQNRENANAASVPSIMISGGSNFPVRKKEKQNAREDKLMAKYTQIKSLLDKIQNIRSAENSPIKSGDPNAIETLNAKIEKLSAEQEKMKATNAYYRKNGTMKGFSGITDEQAEKCDSAIKSSYSWQQCPYPSYMLTNNNANIKRLKERVAEIEKQKSIAVQGGAQYETNGICEVHEDETDMRIRLIFDGKPSEEIRDILKNNGFVWSPRATAWQRQLNENGRYAVKRVIELLKKQNGGAQ